MTIVLGGDFRQILPVIPSGIKEHIIDATITNSYLWPYFEILTLKENMRLKHNNTSIKEKYEITEFSNGILDIGNGILDGIKNTENEDATWIKIHEIFLLYYDSNPIEKITHSIYGEFIHNFNNIEYIRQRAIVSLKNKTVDEINKYILSLVHTESKNYYSYDTILPSSGNIDELSLLYPDEFLQTLNFNGFIST